ncbi:transmembrane protein 79-like [Archocentrus centrarchus]|uniref:transmembrane protein 79-like n=1 Tax=Archocentrus centrarchus TaxID=63155 RepID=UPI0011EA4FA2|nr:transmembrane protein 79-like [Archocentrus centrarchus]XP_030606371.1 transmembrane protein 79-like [Archocentrus centrarchus]XP_030606372.1 transmembrane protein 79-like [Archocentrus centrarchus]
MEDSGGTKTKEGEEEAVRSAMTEASTLPWSADRQTGGWTGKVDRMSVRSGMSLPEVSSCTESERELKAEGERRGGRVSLNEGVGLSEDKIIGHLMEEEPGENLLPEKAAQVFSPAVNALHSPSSLRNWELESEKSPFLGPRGVPEDYNQHDNLYGDLLSNKRGQCCVSTDVLKMGVSLMTSALFFPLLVWGGFVFLPFDAPLLDGAPLRLIYTLRCSVFAATPIILGWLVLGISRLRSGVLRPLFDDEIKEAELQEVTVHQRFITDSASLFLIYFLQLVVMAMYLSQEQLKLVPLLTILFAFGRLAYWVAAAFGSSIRGFGFGLSFLPSIVMMAANFYFIFTMDAASSIFSLPLEEAAAPPPAGRQRFWG